MAMTIANRLKRIASKWGVESKSHTIEDVLEDLENGLPFGVKTEMVEIYPKTSAFVPPQTITTKFDGKLTVGKNYIVVFNDKPYNCTAYTLENLPSNLTGGVFLGNAIHSYFPISNAVDTGEDFLFSVLPSGSAGWDINQDLLLQDITLQIFGEQEVVTPLGYQFMPEGYPKVETQLVEIVPEQSVAIDDQGNFSITDDFTLVADKEYSILFNGKTYVEKAKTASEPAEIAGAIWLGFNPFLDTDMDKPYMIMKHPVMGKMTGTLDATVLGKTITLAIYGEQEIVKPLDPKFVGGGSAILNFSRDSDASQNICDNMFEVFDNAYKNRKPINATFTEYTINEHRVGYLDEYVSWDDGSYVLTFRRLDGGSGFSYGLSSGRVIKQIRWYPDGRIEDYEIIS